MFSWAAIRLLLSGALKGLLSGLSAAFEWFSKDWTRFPFVAFFVAFNVLVWFKIPGIERERDDNLAGWIAERDAHAATVDNYRAAALLAALAAEQNKIRVETEWRTINEEQARDFQNRLGDARARYDRLVSLREGRGAGTDPRRADAAGLPQSAASPGRVAEAPGDRGLPASGAEPPRVIGPAALCPAGRVCLTLEEALIATEQALQLDALISVIERQAAVPVTPARSEQEANRGSR